MPIPRLHVAMLAPTDLIPHLGRGDKHWKVGRSAHALCTTWQKANGLPKSMRAVLGASPTLASLELVDAFLERLVELGDGRRPSQTDLMAICTDSAGLFVIGVEGKVDEPFGERVSDWRDDSPGKEARLHNLCNMLGLDTERVGALRYQLLHRTASVILEARRYHASRGAMLVHSFCSKNTGFGDFSRFAEAMGFECVVMNAIAGPVRVGGLELYAGWVADDLPTDTALEIGSR